MRPTRQVLVIGSIVWAVVGAAVAAAVALRRGALRWAGVFLLLSVATPTYFAWALNLPALVIGLRLATAPSTLGGAVLR